MVIGTEVAQVEDVMYEVQRELNSLAFIPFCFYPPLQKHRGLCPLGIYF